MSDEQHQSQATDPDEGQGSTAVAPAKTPAPTKRKPRQLPPYRVLLHNDDVNTFEHVVRAILNLTTVPPTEALVTTLEAHESGVALLLVTHKERAELYVEQFATFSISITMEPT